MAVKTTLNKKQIFQQLLDHADDIQAYGVRRLGLFGSAVRGEESDESDIDILVEYKKGKKNYTNFIELVFLLEDILHRDVNLVTRKAIADWIFIDIEKEIEYVEFSS